VRHVLWTPQAGAGLEHLQLSERYPHVFADSLLIGADEGEPYRLRYRITCDDNWRAIYVHLALIGEDKPILEITVTGNGQWTDAQGRHLTEFDGCIDIDITATPFTNTLPIRRLGLQPGESADIDVVYINVPELTIERSRQRYTCLRSGTTGSTYRFQTLDYEFAADITVDQHGLVLDYPGLFRRVLIAQ
jgi:hypothetical protein